MICKILFFLNFMEASKVRVEITCKCNLSLSVYTVEPRFNEPLHNEVLGIMNNIFQPSYSVMYGIEP